MDWVRVPALRPGGPAAPARDARDRPVKKEGRADRARRRSRAAPSPRRFWGKAWCDNLECYSDFANRLPRGRTYVRNGSVVDLQIDAGQGQGPRQRQRAVQDRHRDRALVQASLAGGGQGAARGQIGSLVELLQGKLSKGGHGDADPAQRPACSRSQGDRVRVLLPRLGGDVQARRGRPVRRRRAPRHQPELLFPLRRVDHLELLTAASSGGGPGRAGRRDAQADRRDRAGRGLWDRTGRVLEGARPATGGPTRRTAEGSVGRRPDSTGRATVRDPEAPRTVRPRRATPGARADRPARSPAALRSRRRTARGPRRIGASGASLTPHLRTPKSRARRRPPGAVLDTARAGRAPSRSSGSGLTSSASPLGKRPKRAIMSTTLTP